MSARAIPLLWRHRATAQDLQVQTDSVEVATPTVSRATAEAGSAA